MTTVTPDRESAQSGSGLQGLGRSITARFRGPTASLHMVLGLTLLLIGIGLMMVQSSSSVRAFAESSSPYYFLLRQTIYICVGLVFFYGAMRVRFETVTRYAHPVTLITGALLVAVLFPGIGSEVNGSRGWISFGVFAIQPAEIARLAMIVSVAVILAPRVRTSSTKEYLFPSILPVAGIAGLTVIAPDLGMATAVILAYIVLLFLAGFSGWKLFWFLTGSGVIFGVFATTMAYRMSRLQVYLDTVRGNFDRASAEGYQSYQGLLSLAEGGLFGQGIGQSSAKWYYLPEASNDFIFAIIGEELGWIGATFVIGLYIGIALVGIRIAKRSVDPLRRLIAGTVATTIALQAFINIGYVVGLLPVTGIQLPLISYGGSSAVVTLTSLGLLANCARHEPEAISDYQSRPPSRRRWWSLPEPQPYQRRLVPESTQPGRSSKQSKRFGEPVTRPRAIYETVPVVREGSGSRTMMTGRTSRPAREERRRDQSAASKRGAPNTRTTQAPARREHLRAVPSAPQKRERIDGRQQPGRADGPRQRRAEPPGNYRTGRQR